MAEEKDAPLPELLQRLVNIREEFNSAGRVPDACAVHAAFIFMVTLGEPGEFDNSPEPILAPEPWRQALRDATRRK